MARRFLWIITILIVLVLAGAFAFRLFSTELMRFTFVPTESFEQSPQPTGPDYSRPETWIAKPDLPDNPALWLPEGITNQPNVRASVFFIHPTSYLTKDHWNAPLDDAESQWRARLFVQSQASAFNGVGEIWAPRYRQATVGAFLSKREDAEQAIDFAYRDVRAAFEEFLKEAPANRPIILAAHSQGSLHLLRLLQERIAGKPEAKRIAAAYVVGWPISIPIDLPRLGLPACEKAEDSGCILAWQSFAEPAEPNQLMAIYNASMGPNGESRNETQMLCVNPLTGNGGDAAPAEADLGTLIPNDALTEARIEKGLTPARCDPRGLLLIGENPPKMPPYALPGNNYHVFDYTLFWANVRADADRRLTAFLSAAPKGRQRFSAAAIRQKGPR